MLHRLSEGGLRPSCSSHPGLRVHAPKGRIARSCHWGGSGQRLGPAGGRLAPPYLYHLLITSLKGLVSCHHTQAFEPSLLPPNPAGAVAIAGVTSPPRVEVQVERTSWNSRRLFASVYVGAPVGLVWSALTDYENLATFIPSLVENRCLEKRQRGAVLYQVGPLTCEPLYEASTCWAWLNCGVYYRRSPAQAA